MKQKLMIEAYAKLEGVEVQYEDCQFSLVRRDNGALRPYANYDPIANLYSNCVARDKYEVHIEYFEDSYHATIWDDAGLALTTCVKAKSKEDIPRAVIECILRSKGLWHEE